VNEPVCPPSDQNSDCIVTIDDLFIVAEKWLDWNKLGPVATRYHTLISDTVKADTRKLDSFEDFQKALDSATATSAEANGPGQIGSLKSFADQRRAYLLGLETVKSATIPPGK